ncbi:transposase [Xanthobacter aminoxidans]|uniref:Transposase n=1 Tax=Xanthobacter aminoxidans TaxID=186280 RepID=A0ABW6ZHU2_9HYPH
MGSRRRVFPGAFKREAVERVASSGLFTSQVAQELGPHETVLRRWVRDLAPQATEPARHPIPQAAAPSPVDLAAENARLRRENERLRMERDISKKGPCSSSERPPDEVRVRRRASRCVAGPCDVRGLGAVRQRPLCLACPSGELARTG